MTASLLLSLWSQYFKQHSWLILLLTDHCFQYSWRVDCERMVKSSAYIELLLWIYFRKIAQLYSMILPIFQSCTVSCDVLNNDWLETWNMGPGLGRAGISEGSGLTCLLVWHFYRLSHFEITSKNGDDLTVCMVNSWYKEGRGFDTSLHLASFLDKWEPAAL